ncbi:MAG TPA: putative glycoside hydrolase [Candidatus Sulfotelmatobacter sp.]|nr:putative glycoside hydrolase [Candidatus Sulfotelmatobacter sp.]
MRHFSSRAIVGCLCVIFALSAWVVAPRSDSSFAAYAQTPQARPAIASKPAQLQPASVSTKPLSSEPRSIAPVGSEMYTAKRGEAIPTIARHYLGRTSYLTSSELAAAIRAVNHKSDSSNILKANETIVVPGILPAPITEKNIPVAKDFEARAVYLTGVMAGSDHGLRIIRHWREVGGNAVVFDIKDSDGSVNIPFQHPLLGEHKVYIHDVPKFVHFLHQENMHAIARIAIFRDERLVKEHPELAVQSRKNHTAWRENGKLVWTDPSNPVVQDYDIALAKHVAQLGVDEVQFDYVRFPAEGDQKDAAFKFQNDLTQTELEASNTCQEGNQAGTGASVGAVKQTNRPRKGGSSKREPITQASADKPTPRTSASAKKTKSLCQFAKPRGQQRSDVIAAFLNKAYSEIHPTGVLLSLDVFGVMAWQRSVDLAHTGQDIVQMARHCDILSPMIYPSHFFGMDNIARPGDEPAHFIGESMDRFELITKGSGVVIRPWLQAFHWRTKTYSPEYIKIQVETARTKGGIGFLFWNAANDYSKPFTAMPEMKAENYKERSKDNPKYFRGDELSSPTVQAELKR